MACIGRGDGEVEQHYYRDRRGQRRRGGRGEARCGTARHGGGQQDQQRERQRRRRRRRQRRRKPGRAGSAGGTAAAAARRETAAWVQLWGGGRGGAEAEAEAGADADAAACSPTNQPGKHQAPDGVLRASTTGNSPGREAQHGRRRELGGGRSRARRCITRPSCAAARANWERGARAARAARVQVESEGHEARREGVGRPGVRGRCRPADFPQCRRSALFFFFLGGGGN